MYEGTPRESVTGRRPRTMPECPQLERRDMPKVTEGVGQQSLGKDSLPHTSRVSGSPHFLDTNECIQFPFVCPRDKPVCVNTYGSYRCRTNKRCSQGYEPNEDGTACVGEWGLAEVQ